MKYFFSIVLVFVMLYMMYFPAACLNYIREEEAEFSGLLLSKSVDYAGKAAMAACMETPDLELAYYDPDYIMFSPDMAANAFASTLCLSYGLSVSQQNIDSIITKIPVMAFAVNDGYFIAEWQNTEDGTEFVWKPKKAYVIDTDPDNPNTGLSYGVELNMSKLYIADKQTLSVSEYLDYSGFPFDQEVIFQYVNRGINRDVNAALTRWSLDFNKENVQSFYLPVSVGTTGVQRIEKPSLIIVLQDIDIDGIRPKSLSVINGMRATQRRFVIGWTNGSGKKYYSYSGKADSTAQIWIEQNGVIFNSMQEAADNGYLPYFN